jgi:hypothetical protein
MDWIDLAQDRNQWRALVNTIMNLQFPYSVGKLFNGCITGASPAGLSSMEVVISIIICSRLRI